MYLIKRIFGHFRFESKSSLKKKLKNEISSRENLEKKVTEADEKLKEILREREEFEEFSEICLKERDEIKKKYGDLKLFLIEKSYKKIMEDFLSLSKLEADLLMQYIPKKISEKNFKDKIKYQKIHSDPKGFEGFLIKLSRVKYVDEIHGGKQTHRNAKKTFFDRISRKNNIFILEGLYAENRFGKYVFAHTTARNELEANYIKDFLNSFFK